MTDMDSNTKEWARQMLKQTEQELEEVRQETARLKSLMGYREQKTDIIKVGRELFFSVAVNRQSKYKS